MMLNFFRTLNSYNVRYMIISGQATVLYGAATFSEDIDLWVAPDKENWRRFIKCLQKLDARIYKLTPPIKPEFIRKGHGFHFELKSKHQAISPWFLDVMGSLPRVSSFEKVWESAVFMETDWGKVPVVGLRALVEIKKTRRLEDYPVISNLVRSEYERLTVNKINPKDWKWILINSYEVEDLLYYLKKHQKAYRIAESLSRPCLSHCLKVLENPYGKKNHLESTSRDIALEIETLRNKDRQYWKPIIAELKRLQKKGKILSTGTIPSLSS